eukprot:5140426-Amphidinium_carterae.2
MSVMFYHQWSTWHATTYSDGICNGLAAKHEIGHSKPPLAQGPLCGCLHRVGEKREDLFCVAELKLPAGHHFNRRCAARVQFPRDRLSSLTKSDRAWNLGTLRSLGVDELIYA